MDEQERLKLAKKRRLEQKKKEELNRLKRELKTGEQKNRQQEIREQHTGKYTDRILIFIVTVAILNVFYFLVRYLFNVFFGVGAGMLGLSISMLDPIVQVLILGAGIISAVRNRSVLDDIIGRV
ncbi:hypothetical protein [Rhodohalobacter barkolensis]|uniref:Uncharacterized protein n=1 Tax=Rhodohalobacter barkolensis TaxID=2053187 RepID=A0A2N0VIX0_9BACT|nr:hypothetical protein [Rhodohalobacter barkolensis]PKD44136.1 hypothetical protein CWD77_01315 [Rhodohalobacter barkolensis]